MSGNNRSRKIKVDGIRETAPGIFFIWFKKEFRFTAGQVIGITDDPAVPTRLYSIASGEDEPVIRILFDIREGGYLTPRLAALKKGDEIYYNGPTGEFTCNGDAAYWIATGTGIAPFASMFYSGLWPRKMLIHGGRTLDSFYFEEDFSPVLTGNYIRCCSAEKGNGVYEGRLTSWLQEKEFLPNDRKYYLCGSAEMVVQTRDIILSKGVAFDRITAEIYF